MSLSMGANPSEIAPVLASNASRLVRGMAGPPGSDTLANTLRR